MVATTARIWSLRFQTAAPLMCWTASHGEILSFWLARHFDSKAFKSQNTVAQSQTEALTWCFARTTRNSLSNASIGRPSVLASASCANSTGSWQQPVPRAALS